MFGPVGRIDIGILYRVPGMDHLPVADIDTYMGHRRARRVGAGEENQISRLGVFSGNRGAHVEKPLGCGASHTGNTALIEDIGNKAAAKSSRFLCENSCSAVSFSCGAGGLLGKSEII